MSCLSFIAASLEEEVNCTAPYEKVHTSCISFNYDLYRSWDGAAAKCAHDGGFLLVISDLEEKVTKML